MLRAYILDNSNKSIRKNNKPTQKKNEQETCTGTSQKRIYKWPINTLRIFNFISHQGNAKNPPNNNNNKTPKRPTTTRNNFRPTKMALLPDPTEDTKVLSKIALMV